MTTSMDDSDDEFDQIVTPDNELDKVCPIIQLVYTALYIMPTLCTMPNDYSVM